MSEAYTLMHIPVRLVETVQGIASGRLVAVPREPTEAMLTAGSEATTAWGTYRLMLTAAPEAPDAQGNGGSS